MTLVSARRTVVPKPERAGIVSLKWRERPDIGANSRGHSTLRENRTKHKGFTAAGETTVWQNGRRSSGDA